MSLHVQESSRKMCAMDVGTIPISNLIGEIGTGVLFTKEQTDSLNVTHQ
jgi:hypothetical protein